MKRHIPRATLTLTLSGALVRRLAPVRVRHIVNPRTVLPPDVVALPILRRRVNRVIEHIQQLVERYNARIVDDMHRLRMSAAAAYLLIGRVHGLAVRIAADARAVVPAVFEEGQALENHVKRARACRA